MSPTLLQHLYKIDQDQYSNLGGRLGGALGEIVKPFSDIRIFNLKPFSHGMSEKVSITIDLVEDTILLPLETDFEQLLWHVAILKQEESEITFLCSGTVVEKGHVVTAASCVANVRASELRVVAGLTLLRSPHHTVENPHSVFTVTKKYYRYHRGGLDKDDLVVLKLENKATFKAPQLTTLEASNRYSKQCFTLGWGLHNQSSDTSRCPNPSFQDSVNSMLHDAGQSKAFLNKVLDIRNFMGFSSMFIFQLSRILDILPGFPSHGSISNYTQEAKCYMHEVARVKAVRLSTKHPYECLCRKANRICLYSMGMDNIAQQVDIGSPVFCKLKKPKAKSRSLQNSSSKFVLAGVITNKETEEVRWLKHGSSISMITATNVTALTEFILAVLFDKN